MQVQIKNSKAFDENISARKKERKKHTKVTITMKSNYNRKQNGENRTMKDMKRGLLCK